MQRFGAGIYIADLVGIAIVREMAAIVNRIVMAGRTGGAYAAHLATMQGNEEIDALNALGIPVFDFLVLPRIAALVTMMPLLYLYGCAVGLFGGYIVSIATLDLTSASFMEQLRGAVAGTQFAIGLAKSVVFGALIALAGCHIGLQSRTQCRGCGPRRDTKRSWQELSGSSPSMRYLPSAPMRLGFDAMAPQRTCRRTHCRSKNLTVAFGQRVIQRDLSFSIRQGSIFAIMGGSGCGKSTVLKAMVGLLRPSSGTITVDGEDYWAATEARRAAISRRFGVLFQSGALWSSMTVAENVALPLQMFTSLAADAIAVLVQLKLSLVGLAAAGWQDAGRTFGGHAQARSPCAGSRPRPRNPALRRAIRRPRSDHIRAAR